MIANSIDFNVFAVEEKTFGRVEFKIAQTNCCAVFIAYFAFVEQNGFQTVQIRSVDVPKLRASKP